MDRSDAQNGRWTRADAAALAGVCLLALAVRLYVALALPNVLWPDEIFQTLEQAHRLVFGNGVVPWEFRSGARSWLLPGGLAGVVAATQGLGAGSSGYLLGVAAFLCLLSLAPVAAGFAWGRRRAGLFGGVAAGLILAGWFELVFFAPKALSEVVGAHVLVAGLFLVVEGRGERGRGIAAGALVGLAVALRPQLAPAALVAAAWLWTSPRRAKLGFAAAALVVLLLAGLLDRLTWGSWFGSYLAYWRANVAEGRSARYGTAPWYAYAGVVARVWSGGGLLLLVPAVLGARRLPLLAASAAAILAVHSALGHKEYRFIYPALALAMVLVAVGVADLAAQLRGARGRAAVALALAACIGLVSVGLALRFDSRLTDLTGTERQGQWHFARHAAALEAMDRLSRREDLCGLALAFHWSQSGGYAHLHRDVPIVEVSDAMELTRPDSPFNALLAPERVERAGIPGMLFRREQCWPDGLCLFVRPGGCGPAGGRAINEVLRQRGE